MEVRLLDREKAVEMMDKLYRQGKMDKDILKRCVDRVRPEILVYLTKEEYKLITGEDWTKPVE